MKKLAVLLPFFNPFGNELMEQNLIKTAKHLLEVWPHIFVVEAKYEDDSLNQNTMARRTPKGVKHFYLKTKDVMFHKEQMLNVMARQLCEDYKVVASMDADILFIDRYWPQRIFDALDEFDLIQCFHQGVSEFRNDRDGTPKDYPIFSCMFQWIKNGAYAGSPGGAWAGRKKFWEVGLFDSYVLGSNDSCTFDGVTGRARTQIPVQYKKVPASMPMHNKVIKYTEKMMNIAAYYAKNEVKFQFHTTATAKRYGSRHAIMRDFDPDRELKVNDDGLYEWVNPQSSRAKLIREYFEIKDDPQKTWATIVRCRCVEATPTDNGFFRAGDEGFFPMQAINNHFEIIWT